MTGSSKCRSGQILSGCSKTSDRASHCAAKVAGVDKNGKPAENGTFVSTETTYCRLTKMRATDLVLDALERVQPSVSSPDDPLGPSIEAAARMLGQARAGDDHW